MALVVFNPTNEVLTGTYVGETVDIEPDQKIKMDDARARHLLNVLGPRGLMSLEYGDEGHGVEKKATEGRRRNREFKRQQVLRYNQTNEAHKQQGLPYVQIPEQIQDYAKELGLVLVQPYQYKDKEVEEIADLREERDSQGRYIRKLEDTNKDLQAQIGELTNQMQTLMSMLKPQNEETADPQETEEGRKVELARIRKELGYTKLPKQHFENWIPRRWDEIHAAPQEIQEEIHSKYRHMFNKPFPAERPEIQDAA